MHLSMPGLFRSKKRIVSHVPSEPALAPSTPVPAAPKAPTLKNIYELQNELRDLLNQFGKKYFELGEVVRGDAVNNCRLFADRNRAIEILPKGGIVAEVGTQTGRFADHIYRTAKPKKLHLFDLSLEWFDKSMLVEPIREGEVQIHLGDSSANLGKFPAEHFDWLYIDGDHSYEGVKRDIAQATRAVKRDGFLVFNDYTIWSPMEVCNYGVLRAVNELINEGEWEFVYLALHPWSYHDVALRRKA